MTLTATWNKRAILLAVVLLCAAGCTERTVEGSRTTWTMQQQWGILILVGSLATLAVGLGLVFLWKHSGGWVLVVIGGLVAAVVPGMLLYGRVLVDDDHLEANYGFWFAPTRHDIRFADVRELNVGSQEVRGRRGTVRHQATLQYTLADGRTGEVTGDLLRAAMDEILERARKQGVRINGQSDADPEVVRAALLLGLTSKDAFEQTTARETLGYVRGLGHKARGATGAILEGLKAQNALVRQEAAGVLAAVNPAALVPGVLRYNRDGLWFSALTALLTVKGSAPGEPPLREVLRDGDGKLSLATALNAGAGPVGRWEAALGDGRVQLEFRKDGSFAWAISAPGAGSRAYTGTYTWHDGRLMLHYGRPGQSGSSQVHPVK